MSQLKLSGVLETELKELNFSKYPKFKKLIDWYIKNKKPETGFNFSMIIYRSNLQNIIESVESANIKRIKKYISDLNSMKTV